MTGSASWINPAPMPRPLRRLWRLLLGDESALPAIGSILEGPPAGSRAIAFAEIPSMHDVQRFDTVAEVTVHWLPRVPTERVGTRLLGALGELSC